LGVRTRHSTRPPRISARMRGITHQRMLTLFLSKQKKI
jgi:hypothetical protein